MTDTVYIDYTGQAHAVESVTNPPDSVTRRSIAIGFRDDIVVSSAGADAIIAAATRADFVDPVNRRPIEIVDESFLFPR